jgi:hypothetical protein
MIVGVFSPSITIQGSARKHDPAEYEIRLLIPVRWKGNGADRIFHSRVFAEWFVKREERSREHSRAGQRNRKFPKR